MNKVRWSDRFRQKTYERDRYPDKSIVLKECDDGYYRLDNRPKKDWVYSETWCKGETAYQRVDETTGQWLLFESEVRIFPEKPEVVE